ncbi:MAG: tRNA dimethylallyltransferase [Rubrobacteraceae bacterium]
MQVYREIPVITNQKRRRPARLSGIISVTGEWSVADHRLAAMEEFSDLSRTNAPLVLDAGAGMYLNAVILDIPLAPKVSTGIRQKARRVSGGAENPRRASRAKELQISGGDFRGSIWDGELLFETNILYIKPDRTTLDAAIENRSKKIVSSGVEEARRLQAMISAGASINPSVLDSIGVKELLSHLSGQLDLEQAEERINIRTRRLARRQIRWFDKLAKTLADRASIKVLDSPSIDRNTMHDIIATWNP